ncbi:MAG: CDP-archaeol synthase [Elusimicrobia bacterium]|nr:CDP-archaeol synthase [Elusimicrobiota bacterium]
MLYRILIALGLIPVVLVAIYIGYIPFFVLICGSCLFAAYEYWILVSKMGFVPRKIFGNIIIFLVITSIFFSGQKFASFDSSETTTLIFTMSVPLLFIFEIIRYDIRTAIPALAITFLGIIYLGWLPGHFLLLRDLRPDGFKYTLLLFITVWSADSAAYFFGSAYGTHRLSRISPKKSIEGMVASIAGAIFVIFAWKFLTSIQPLNKSIFYISSLKYSDVFFLGILISVSSQFGDLAESLIKRSAGVKDSSTLLKEHGGVLDKLDSFIFSAPVFYYYIKFFVL